MKKSVLLALFVSLLLVACTTPTTVKASYNEPQKVAPTVNSSSTNNWQCQWDEEGQWYCREPGAFVDLTKNKIDVETNIVSSIARIGIAKKDITKTSVTVSSNKNLDRNSNLQAYPDSYFAIQLIAAQNSQTIARYQQLNPHLLARSYSMNIKGQLWQLLILEVYSSREAAKKAVLALNPAPTTAPWVRPLGALKSALVAP